LFIFFRIIFINVIVSRNINFSSIVDLFFGTVRLLEKLSVNRYLFFAAIAAIRSHPQPIASFEEVAAIRGVGARMGEKIRELLAYGRITKVTVCCISSPAIRGVGARMGEKIRELLAYGRITKVSTCCISAFMIRI
jgi:hypothetical protein